MDDSDDRDRQQQRALDAIAAINAGANPAHEAYQLANDYTDRQSARFIAWLRRLARRPSA